MDSSRTTPRDPLIGKLRLTEDAGTERLLDELCTVPSARIVGFLNQHGYNLAQRNPQVFYAFSRIDYLLRDGIGIKLACAFNRTEAGANLNGSDFIPRLIDRLLERDAPVEFFALGTAEPWLGRGADKLFRGQPVHTLDGFQGIEAYLEFFRSRHQAERTPVIVLAMGMPKQERVATRLQQLIDGPALLICGGAILDFAAERFPRAPELFRRTGLEWAFRLLNEPRRLFKRYGVGIPLFFAYVARNSLAPESIAYQRVLLARDYRSASTGLADAAWLSAEQIWRSLPPR